jgi:membrane fusion protein (multidrug efflux system)
MLYCSGAACIMAFITACEGKAAEGKPAVESPGKPPIVDVIVASAKNLANTVEATGSIVANEYVELHPEISGRITYLHVPEGARIQQGELIARIYDDDLQAQLQKSKVQLDLFQKTEDRDRQLLAINGINQSDYDIALNNVKSTQADIAYTLAQINKTMIKAPFSGVVGLRQVSPGAYVSPSSVIATLQQVDKTKVDFMLPEQYRSLIKKGATVDVLTDVTDSVKQKAVIIATEPQVNTMSRNIRVRAVLAGGYQSPGAFVKVYVKGASQSKAILVPTNAIIPDDKNNQLVVVKNGKAAFVNVQTGLRMANNVAITSGLDPGDTVVVTGVLFARPSAPLTIRNVKTID